MRGEMKTRQDEPGVYADPLLNAVVLENRSKVVPWRWSNQQRVCLPATLGHVMCGNAFC